jgi:flagellar protein FlaG
MTIDTLAAASASRIDKSYARRKHRPHARPYRAPAPSNARSVPQDASREPSRAQLDQAVSALNQSSQIKTQDWNFPSTNSQRTVVKVIDQETKEVLRQIPTKEALALAKAFDSAKGSPDQPKRRHARVRILRQEITSTTAGPACLARIFNATTATPTRFPPAFPAN